jgi:hypothetical protein
MYTYIHLLFLYPGGKTNEQWLKAFWDPWFKAGNQQQREKVRIE